MSENNPLFHVERDTDKKVPRGTNQIQITSCPLCGNSSFDPQFRAIDHTVTGESFSIQACVTCHFHITNPQPSPEQLGAYYASESYVSHSESKKGFINSLYHIAQKKNLRYKFNACRARTTPGLWADYGSGAGAFVQHARKHGQDIVGYEPNDDARTIASAKGIETIPVYQFPNARKYACVTMWHVLEHVPNLQEVLKAIYDSLLPQGVLVIAVPNHKSYDSKFYKTNWAALDVPRHLWHFTQQDIEKIAVQLGLSIEAVMPMPLDSYYISMLSEKYINGSIVRGIAIGLLSNLKGRLSTRPYSSQIYILRK